MSKEFDQLRKTLEDANNENDKLEALDRYSRKLSDEELESVVGGLYTEENCPGQVSAHCFQCPQRQYREEKGRHVHYCPITDTKSDAGMAR